MNFLIRSFHEADTDAVNRVALAAFAEYRSAYSDPAAFFKNIGNMAALSKTGEIIVAENNGEIAGAVAYIGPGKPKSDFFKPDWPIIRMLVVDPQYRGHRIGRALTDACITRAKRDCAHLIALHTTPIMHIALPMYERIGFRLQYEAPPIFGVPYAVYTMDL